MYISWVLSVFIILLRTESLFLVCVILGQGQMFVMRPKATSVNSHSSLPILTVTDSWKESYKPSRPSLHFIEMEAKPLKIAIEGLGIQLSW